MNDDDDRTVLVSVKAGTSMTKIAMFAMNLELYTRPINVFGPLDMR
jgi:hypothetical protein